MTNPFELISELQKLKPEAELYLNLTIAALNAIAVLEADPATVKFFDQSDATKAEYATLVDFVKNVQPFVVEVNNIVHAV